MRETDLDFTIARLGAALPGIGRATRKNLL
jgi:hypothetical protein